jgi:zinc protease
MMNRKNSFLNLKTLAAAAIFLSLAFPVFADSPAPVDITGSYLLDNGLELRVMPRPGSGQVATLALVRTGYANESSENSGYSHLLEHIVFSGTDDRTREEISREIKAMGGYLNGYTRDEYTAYILVLHRDDLDRGLDVLSDMLFDSLVEEQAVSEARDVVLEELRRAKTRPDSVGNNWWNRLLYGDSGYSREALGSEMTVANVSREQVAGHYNATYTPDNMLVLMAGDISPADARNAVVTAFGGRPPSGASFKTAVPGSILGQRVYRLSTSMPGVLLRMGFDGPDPWSRDSETLELLAAVLGGEDGLLSRALKSAGIQPRSVGASLSVNSGFSRFQLSVSLSPSSDPAAALGVVNETLRSLPRTGLPQELVDISREAKVAGEVMGQEQLHYYLFGKAPWALAGLPGQGLSLGRWDHLLPEQLTDAAARYLADKPYTALITVPERAAESGPEGAEVVSARALLDNGLTVMAEQRPGSEVFALHLMTRNRSAVEPEGLEGIADFLHRLLPMAAAGMDREEISSRLRELGISLKTAGNPMVPFGDFYTSTGYSHIRMTCVGDKAPEAMELLADVVTSPDMNELDVEKVRGRMKEFLAYRSQRPGTVAVGLLTEELYGELLKGSVYGNELSIDTISREELVSFHREYFTGQNLIVTVVSGLPPAEAISLVEQAFSSLPAGEVMELPGISLTDGSRMVSRELGKSQGALAVGAVTAEVSGTDAVAFPVVSGLINQVLYEKLREKEGLAYSLGASLGAASGKAVFTLSMGTSPDKLETARERVRQEIAAARDMEVNREDLERVVNDRLGTIQRRMMSSINRAFYLGVSVRGDLPHTFGEKYREILLGITPEDAGKAAAAYLPEKDLVEVVVR